jgi:hypothetical protein
MMSVARARQLGLTIAVTAAVALLTLAPAQASRPYFLAGTWFNAANPASTYQLVPSSDLKTLNMTWHGIATHSGLFGVFTGALHGLTSYQGTFRVTEGTTVVNGTGTVTADLLGTPKVPGYPPLSVRLIPDSGAETDLTLEIYIANPEVIPNTPKVEFNFDCPGTQPCSGVTQGDYTGGAASPLIVARAHFKVKAGHSRKLVLSLNKTGRNLLAKRGSIRVRVRVILKGSSVLPHATTVGTVTFHKR